MRRFLIFLGIIILFGCHDPKKDHMHNRNDINDVIKTIVIQDSLYRDSIPLSVDLGKPGVFNRELMFPLSIRELLDPKAAFHFQKLDSSYLDYQLITLTGFKIDKAGIPKSTFTSTAERMN
jgi:hypothetical protein